MSLRIDIRMEEVLRASLTCGKECIQYVCVGDDRDKATFRRDRQTTNLPTAHQPTGILKNFYKEGVFKRAVDYLRATR